MSLACSRKVVNVLSRFFEGGRSKRQRIWGDFSLAIIPYGLPPPPLKPARTCLFSCFSVWTFGRCQIPFDKQLLFCGYTDTQRSKLTGANAPNAPKKLAKVPKKWRLCANVAPKNCSLKIWIVIGSHIKKEIQIYLNWKNSELSALQVKSFFIPHDFILSVFVFPKLSTATY